MSVSAYTKLLTIEINRSLAYRAVMVLSVLFGPIFFGIQYYVWKALFASGTTVSYTFAAMMSYYAVVLLIGYLLHNETAEIIEQRIRQGEMHVVLLRPLSLMGELFMRMMGNRLLALILEIVPLILLFIAVFGRQIFAPSSSWTYGLLAIPIGMLTWFLLRYLVGLTAFWATRNHGLRLFLFFAYWLFSGSFFPLDIMPHWAQIIFFSLPFHLTLYTPASLWLGTFSFAGMTNPAIGVLVGLLWVGVLYTICHLVQARAFSKYQGVGQ